MSVENRQEVNVAVTGAAGQIGYALLPQILQGRVFGRESYGPNPRINLRLLEVEAALPRLEGVAMELDDMAPPTLGEVNITSSAEEAFDGANAVFMVGAMPRGEGMDRSDLLEANAPIFVEQGRALNERAADDVKTLVVGNPANSNALVALSNAQDIPAAQFSAMSRLDHNRAVAEIAKIFGVGNGDVSGLAILGNHSDKMVPFIDLAIAGHKRVKHEMPTSSAQYEEFTQKVAKRGGAVIKARGSSSAMSAATAAADQMRDWLNGSDGRTVSMGVLSQGEYEVPKGIVSSFPVTTYAPGYYAVLDQLKLDDETYRRLNASNQELQEEAAKLHDLGVLPS